jgi:ABC-type Fe3+/spermidine/putrescine transport system ATPase subunit
MAQRVAVMQAGRLLRLDDPRSVYREPGSAYVASLFGPCNFLSEETARQLDISRQKGQMNCLRAEDIRIEREQGGNAIIRKIRYMGAFREVIAEVGDQSLLLHYRDNHIQVGDKVRLHAEADAVIRIPEA